MVLCRWILCQTNEYAAKAAQVGLQQKSNRYNLVD
jgi:hypothetical protein